MLRASPCANLTLPPLALRSAKIASSNSVLPAPASPAMPKISPLRNSNDASRTTGAHDNRSTWRAIPEAAPRADAVASATSRPAMCAMSCWSVTESNEPANAVRPSRNTVADDATRRTSASAWLT